MIHGRLCVILANDATVKVSSSVAQFDAAEAIHVYLILMLLTERLDIGFGYD